MAAKTIEAIEDQDETEKENQWNNMVNQTIDAIKSVSEKIEKDLSLHSSKKMQLAVGITKSIRDLKDICHDNTLSSPEEIEQRNIAMNEIEDIAKKDRSKFLWKLMTNTLPRFKRAVFGDPDFCNIFRDTNHTGLNYTMAHIDRLRQMSTQSYVATNMWTFDDDRDKKIRQLCMEMILEMPEEDWILAVNSFTVPDFVRAKPGDDDYQPLYRSPCVNSRNRYYCSYRHILRSTDFMEFVSSGDTYDNIFQEDWTELSKNPNAIHLLEQNLEEYNI